MRRMKKEIQLTLIAFLIYCTFSVNNFYTKIAHNTDPQAKCLDGSIPIIYLHEGGDTKNILFYFLGGGSCVDKDYNSTLQNCYKRSRSQFGTSVVWPDYYPSNGFGILEADPTKSKFATWTKIVIIYCDGAYHQGNNKSPIQYKDTKLYFRGAVNTRSHIKWANNKYNFNNANKIVVSGSSAGGIATFLWVDYFRSLVTNSKVVYGIVESGIFYDPTVQIQQPKKNPFNIPTRFQLKTQYLNTNRNLQISLESKKQHKQKHKDNKAANESLLKAFFTHFSNVDEKRTPNKQCSQKISPQQSWQCLFIQYSYPTLKFPLLFIESNYDSFIIPNILFIPCTTPGISGQTLTNCSIKQLAVINNYRNNYIDKIIPKLFQSGNSLWSISCSWHAVMYNTTIYNSELQKVPQKIGLTMRNAVQKFVFDNKRINSVEYRPWPLNKACAY